MLAKLPEDIKVNQGLRAMGGAMYDEKFCGLHAGALALCTNSIDCSLRSLWTILQFNMDKLLDQISIHDLMKSELQAHLNFTKMADKLDIA